MAEQDSASQNPMLAAALQHAVWRGLYLFPCRGKDQPLIDDWPNQASNEPEQLAEWWSKWPDANIGLACGKSSLVAVDLDQGHGNGADGIAAWTGLGISEAGAWIQNTPSGGKHLLYADTSNGQIGNSPGALPRGIDIRGRGGYVLLWPSRTNIGRYTCGGNWIDRPSFLPHTLRAIIQARSSKPVTLEEGQKIGEGKRNDTLASLAGTMRRRGFIEEAILAALKVENARVCDPPLPDRDVATIAHSIARYEPVKIARSLTENEQTSWSAADLLNTDFPSPPWVIPDRLPMGLGFLAGRPKIGKSWLALQLAIAVASGGKFFDKEVAKRPVLYFALEDGTRRMKSRLVKLQATPSALLHFEFRVVPLNTDEGLERFWALVEDHGAALVVIDTLTRSFDGSIDWNDVSPVTASVGILQQEAQSRNVCVLAIDHHRKSTGMEHDSVSDLMGSTGKSGVADVLWGLYRDRGKQDATLDITGREVEETEFAVDFDKMTCQWTMLGDALTVRRETAQDTVISALRQAKEQKGTAMELACHMSMDRANISRVLAELERAGRVQSSRDGHSMVYTLV